MQTQEIYWKQKYHSLEETCNTLKNKLEQNQNTIKITKGKLRIISYFCHLIFVLLRPLQSVHNKKEPWRPHFAQWV